MSADTARLLIILAQSSASGATHADIAAREGWKVEKCASPSDVLARLVQDSGEASRVVLLSHFAAQEQRDMVAQIRHAVPEVPIIVASDNASPLLAIEAMRAGANDVLIDPVAPGRLVRALASVSMPAGCAVDDMPPACARGPRDLDFDAMVGTDARYRTALAKAATAARGHGHILVEGERGTGKATLLRAVHQGSARAKAPLSVVTCEGMTRTSVQSLLFGHEKGAFPGAFARHEGTLAKCDGGTVYIEAVDTLDRETQDRLADALKSGIVRPSGASHGFRIDVRVLATSRRSLDLMVEDGRFSPDLLAVLGATRLALPPLRERGGDIPALTRHFLASFATIEGMGHHSIADSALSLLEAYDWPGNIRQLQTVLFRACVHEQREALTAHSFPHLSTLVGDATRGESRTRGLGVLLYQGDGHLRTLEEIEGDIIRLAIGQYRGKMTEVARRLGIGRSTLYRKLHELGIDNAA